MRTEDVRAVGVVGAGTMGAGIAQVCATAGLQTVLGPLALADLIGLDVCLAILEVLHRDLGEDKYRPAPLLRTYVSAGWLGRKRGRGVYTYD